MSGLLAAYEGKNPSFASLLRFKANGRRPLHGIPILIKVTALLLILKMHVLTWIHPG